MNNIRTITLDLDDTLWEIHPVIRRAEQTLYNWLGQHYPKITELHQPQDLRELRAAVVAEFADRSHDLTFLRREVLQRAAAAADYDDDFVDAAFEVFDKERNSVELFPEVLPALQALKDRYTLIALTNGNASLEKIGIDHLFHGSVSAAIAGAAKPAREIFDMAVAVGGAAAAETLHVGDHPSYDVDGARKAGLRTAWVNREASDWPDDLATPDIEVRHVGELLQHLAEG